MGMTNIEILYAMNTEEHPIYWTKQQQNDAVDAAVDSIKTTQEIREFLSREKSNFQHKVISLEKAEKNARLVLEEENDKTDVREELANIEKLQYKYNALLKFINDVEDFLI